MVLAKERIWGVFSNHSKVDGKRQVPKTHPSTHDYQIKQGIDAYLGMPPLSPLSVNFVYLQALSPNLVGLSKLKSLRSHISTKSLPSPYSPGPPLFDLSFA
jgi:hypothetical protein